MAVIAKLTGKKVKSNGELPLTGTKELYDYLISKGKPELSSLSIINYYSKKEPREINTTRFELIIGDNSSRDKWAVSPRIIAKAKGKSVEYTVEFLSTERGRYSIDEYMYSHNTKQRGYEKNGADLYVLNRVEIMELIKFLFKEEKKNRVI